MPRQRSYDVIQYGKYKDNTCKHILTPLQRYNRINVIESYGVDKKQYDQGHDRRQRWFEVDTEICRLEGRPVPVRGAPSFVRGWFYRLNTGLLESERGFPQARPKNIKQILKTMILTKLNNEHLFKRALSTDIGRIQSATIAAGFEPENFDALKELLRANHNNSLYVDGREALDHCDCTDCQMLRELDPNDRRLDKVLLTVDHDGEDGPRLKKMYGGLQPFEITDELIWLLQQHIFKNRCPGSHHMKDCNKLMLIAAGDMKNLNSAGTSPIYNNTVINMYQVSVEIAMERSGGVCMSNGIISFDERSFVKMHSHHVAGKKPVLIYLGDGHWLVVDMGKRVSLCDIRQGRGGLVNLPERYSREESVIVIWSAIDHKMWHLLHNNKDFCARHGIALPLETNECWMFDIDELPGIQKLVEECTAEGIDITQKYADVQYAEFDEHGNVTNLPSMVDLGDESDDDDYDVDERGEVPTFEILKLPSSSAKPQSTSSSRAELRADHQAWKSRFEIRRHEPIAPPHLTAGLPDPLRHLYPSKTSSSVATTEARQQRTKRLQEELTSLREKKLRAEQEVQEMHERTPLSTITNQDLAISRPTSNPLLTLPPPPVISSQIVLTTSGQSTFVISKDDMVCSVTLRRHDDMNVDVNGVLASSLTVTKKLSLDEYNIYVPKRMLMSDWHIARLAVVAIGDDTNFKRFISYYREKERIACVNVSDSARLYLVVPELFNNATGLRGLNMKTSKLYGVLLYKREVHVGGGGA